MNETKKSAKNFRILIVTAVLVFALVCTCVISAVLMIAPLFLGKQIANTANLLFFDISDINTLLEGEAFSANTSLLIPSETSGMLSVSVKTNTNVDRSYGNGIINLSRGEESLGVKFIYDTENAALAGLGKTPDEYISIPRTNIKDSFDASIFAPGSNSIHTMSVGSYNRLIPLLESSLSPDAEKDDSVRDAISDLAREIAKKVTPRTSIAFLNGKLCLNVTYILERDDIKSILRTVANAFDEHHDLRAYSKAFGTTAADGTNMSLADSLRALCDTDLFTQAVVSYTQNREYVTSFEISSGDVRVRAELIEDNNTVGFDITAEGAKLSYRKNPIDSTYTVAESGNVLASGTIRGGDSVHFTFCADETELIAFSLEKCSAVTDAVSTHRPLLSMSKDELTEYFRSIPIKKVNDLLDGFGIDLSPYITADGKMLLHVDKLVDESELLYDEYISLLKTTDKKIIDTVSKIYIWNDRLNAYILFTYSAEDDTLMLGCAYELTDQILAEYHTAHIGENRIMFVHSIKRIEKVDPTCEEAGKEVYKCEHCDYGYQTDHSPLGHKKVNIYVDSVAHDGTPKTVTVAKCSRCEIFSGLSADNYFGLNLTHDKNGGYSISKFQALKDLGFAYLYLPSLTNTDIKFSGITVTQSDGSFEAINIPEGIEKLGASSIYLSASFKVLILPSTLKEIEDSAFYGNGKPSVIFFSGSEDEWNRIKLGGYSSLWAETEIIFCPGGVTHDDVSKSLFLSCDIEKAVIKQKQMTLTADAARETTKNDYVTLISEEKIVFVDYDEENSLIAYCGVSVGFKTRIEIYDVKAGKIVASFEVNDHINKLAIREGYVAMSGDYSTTVYLYDIAAKETTKFKIDTDGAIDSISQIFIDSGYVYASTKNSHYLASYSINNAKINEIWEMLTIDHLIMNHEYHRIIAVQKYYSEIYFNLIDTEKADFIKNITFSEFKTSSLVKIPHFENVIVTDLGVIYDYDGNVSTEKPLNTPLVDALIPDGLPVASKLYEHIDGAMTLFAESGQKVLLALQNAVSVEPIILDYYAEKAIVTKDGDMIIYTPDSYGLLLVNLP